MENFHLTDTQLLHLIQDIYTEKEHPQIFSPPCGELFFLCRKLHLLFQKKTMLNIVLEGCSFEIKILQDIWYGQIKDCLVI